MANDQKDKDELRRQIGGIWSDLQTIRDEVRVRIHLAGMDLKDTWKDVESRIEELERQRPDATRKVRDAAAELREAFRSLRDKLG